MEAEGIELRDFAVFPQPDRQDTDDTTKTDLSKLSPFWRFWKTHVRITIDEAACRDHLALERTYLAYMRTASAYGQLGVTLAWLFRLNIYTKSNNTPTTLKVGKAMGATVEVMAVIVMLLGAVYFAKQQMGLMRGSIVSRGYEIWVMSVLSFVIFMVIFGLLVAADKW